MNFLFSSVSYNFEYRNIFWYVKNIYIFLCSKYYIYNIYNFDVKITLILIIIKFIILMLFLLIFWFFYLKRSYINDYYINNCNYLWRLFRDSQYLGLASWNWIRDLNTREVLEHYTKQLLVNDFEVPYEKLLRDDNAILTLAKLFNSFSIQKEKISKVYESYSLSKNKLNYNILEEINKFKSLISLMMKLRIKLGLNLTSNFINELHSSLSFNYERFIFDSYYANYYQTYLDDGFILNMFVIKGMQYNYILENIYFNDIEVYITPIDSSEFNIAKIVEPFLISIFNFFWYFDVFFSFKLPNWFFFKDINSVFIYKNRKFDNNFNIIDTQGFSFDLLFLFFFIIPFYFFIFSISFYCKLNHVIRWPSTVDNFIFIKLIFLNYFFIFQNFLKTISLTSWMWNIFNDSTVGNGYPTIYPAFGLNKLNKVLFFLDPLFIYDNIWKNCQCLIIPLDVDVAGSFARSWNFISIKNIFINIFIVFYNYICPFYSSTRLLYFSCILKILIYIFFIIYLYNLKNIYNKKDYNLTMNFLLYIKNSYNNKLSKFNNYFNKIWF